MNPIEQNAFLVLHKAVEAGNGQFNAQELQSSTGLTPHDLSVAVDYLDDLGAIQAIKYYGTGPFGFGEILMKSRGEYLLHEMKKRIGTMPNTSVGSPALPQRPLNPVGSPYGFTADDWEAVSLKKEDPKTLFVVVGMQTDSTHYDSGHIVTNITAHFQDAVQQYNKQNQQAKIALHFEPLHAGFGGHLFNQIARDIIGADIAVFETSDLNPNVMLEMGVALTWGVRVLPVRLEGRPTPPSDVSGQTWMEYQDSAKTLLGEYVDRKLVVMIDHVIRSKGRHA